DGLNRPLPTAATLMYALTVTAGTLFFADTTMQQRHNAMRRSVWRKTRAPPNGRVRSDETGLPDGANRQSFGRSPHDHLAITAWRSTGRNRMDALSLSHLGLAYAELINSITLGA